MGLSREEAAQLAEFEARRAKLADDRARYDDNGAMEACERVGRKLKFIDKKIETLRKKASGSTH